MKKSVGFVCAVLMLAGVSFAAMADECQLPDKEDSYKLALSWQPAFCESHRGKPDGSRCGKKFTVDAMDFSK